MATGLSAAALTLRRYAKAVLTNYINLKMDKGRTKLDISWKLETLEREVRQRRTGWTDGVASRVWRRIQERAKTIWSSGISCLTISRQYTSHSLTSTDR